MTAERSGARNLERSAEGAGAQRLLAFHLERESADGRFVDETSPRPPHGNRHHGANGEPHHEGQHAWQVDPSGAAEPNDATREKQRRDTNGGGAACSSDESRKPAALAVDEIDDRHAAGRLVTAETKRLMPIWNAAS